MTSPVEVWLKWMITAQIPHLTCYLMRKDHILLTITRCNSKKWNRVLLRLPYHLVRSHLTIIILQLSLITTLWQLWKHRTPPNQPITSCFLTMIHVKVWWIKISPSRVKDRSLRVSKVTIHPLVIMSNRDLMLEAIRLWNRVYQHLTLITSMVMIMVSQISPLSRQTSIKPSPSQQLLS